MKLKQAIKMARKKKCEIKCPSLRMYSQTAKSLIYWIVTAESSDLMSIPVLVEMLEATDWEMDLPLDEEATRD